MKTPAHFTTLVGLWITLASSGLTAVASDPTPTPAPTPSPRSLADYARTTALARAPDAPDSAIVITGDNLDQLGRDAVLSVAGSPLPEPWRPDPANVVDPKLRQRWRSKVLAQRARITKLEARRAQAEAEIDRLERGSLDARTLDRIERAEAKRAMIDNQIKDERAVLSRIVSEARKQGAQPGWFR